jgi:hypothetical protein
MALKCGIILHMTTLKFSKSSFWYITISLGNSYFPQFIVRICVPEMYLLYTKILTRVWAFKRAQNYKKSERLSGQPNNLLTITWHLCHFMTRSAALICKNYRVMIGSDPFPLLKFLMDYLRNNSSQNSKPTASTSF